MPIDESDIAFANTLADAAGEVIVPYFRQRIDVIDKGCGMSPAFLREKLFKPFVSSKTGGFGVGAFEALQLAQAMGGTLEVTSREGEGSRFRVTLPVARDTLIGKAA